ncbi:MAG: acyltransferase family protein [Paracoccaceae bacterium]
MNHTKLDGLQIGRAIAALAVVIFHAKLTLIRFPEESYIRLPYFYEHGDIGVPFFFVISGFIICYVTDRSDYDATSFFIKRSFRLWPIYAVCTALYVLVYILHRDRVPSELGYNVDYILLSLVFWPMQSYPALHPGWSLEHEVLFYILAGLTAIVAGPRTLLMLLLGLVAYGVWGRIGAPALGLRGLGWDYHVFARVNVCFAVGIVLYLVWRLRPCPSPTVWIAMGLIAVIAAPYIGQAIPNAFHNAVASANLRQQSKLLIEAAGSAVLLYGLIAAPCKGRFARALVHLGDRSYSLYLVHFVFVAIFQNLHREVVRWPEWMAEPLCVVFVVVSIATAYFLFWTVEQPTNAFGGRAARTTVSRFPRLRGRNASSPKSCND